VSAADLAAWRERGRLIPVTPHGHQAFLIDEGDQAAAPDETAVLIHGFPESSYSYAGALPLLRERFARVVCFDLIGYGFSDKPARGYTYSLFEQADVVLRLLRERSVSGCHWVSHDMGDSVTTELLARLNDNRPAWFADGLRSLTLTNANMALRYAKLRAGQKFLLSPLGNRLSRMGDSSRFLTQQIHSAQGNEELSDEQIADMASAFSADAPPGLMADLIGYLHERRRFEQVRWLPALRDTRVPVHICWGADDRVSPVPVAQYLARQVKPDAKLTVIDGLGHFLQLQDPQRWFAALAPFWE
jgi:pimeloyl-ACP methyl ester carboxylesterase